MISVQSTITMMGAKLESHKQITAHIRAEL